MTTSFQMTAEAARDWKTFVANFVAFMTSKKANRELVNGYQVKQVRAGYQITWNGKDSGYGTMDAATLYSWMERLPLVYFSREADDIRSQLLSA